MKQRDPLSSYLFVLAMEALSLGGEEGISSRDSKWTLGGRGEGRMEVSHLLFLDNTLILFYANQQHLEYLNWVFIWFELISSLKRKLALWKGQYLS